MDHFFSLQVFRRVAEQRSFKAAADHFNVSPTAISKQVQALEDRVGARLLHRTTRRVHLTEVGAEYLRRCIRILEDLAEAEAIAGQSHARPRGTLRIGAPVNLGVMHLSDAIVSFLEAYPEMKVDLDLSDETRDPLREGYDLALRVDRSLKDSSWAAASLGCIRRVLVATPAYLAKKGTPRSPDDLRDHDALIYTYNPEPEIWTFEKAGRTRAVPVNGTFRANNSAALKVALLRDRGICLIPSFYVVDEIKAGKLKVLLRDHEPQEMSLYAIFPQARILSGKVRAFVDFIKRDFARRDLT